jgi:hypothetical protein
MTARATTISGNANRYIYYNARLDNFEIPGTQSKPTQARFIDNRPAPIITKAKDYELSIVRFQCSLQSLPALIVEHEPNSTTNTAYRFEVSDGTVSKSAIVQWVPSVPGRVPGSGDFFDMYFWEYDFIRFTVLVNTAIENALDQLKAETGQYNGVASPYFSYDTDLGVFSLTAPVEFYTQSNQLQLWANNEAHHLYCGFPATPYNNKWRYDIIAQPNELTNPYLTRRQVPGSLTTWNPVRRFIFTSQTLPVLPEGATSVTNYETAEYQGGGLASQTIISDLIPDIFRGDELRSGTLNYNPSAEFRCMDLISDGELRDIDFQIFWEDPLGNLHPHILLHNDFVSAKFMFRRKD